MKIPLTPIIFLVSNSNPLPLALILSLSRRDSLPFSMLTFQQLHSPSSMKGMFDSRSFSNSTSILHPALPKFCSPFFRTLDFKIFLYYCFLSFNYILILSCLSKHGLILLSLSLFCNCCICNYFVIILYILKNRCISIIKILKNEYLSLSFAIVAFVIILLLFYIF